MNKFLTISFFSVIAMFPFFAAQSKDLEKNAIIRDFIVVDSPHEYDFNPHTASYASEAQLLTSLHEGLFSYDPFSLEPQNALAESYKISRDKLTWTFTIREDVHFSNGDLITAPAIRNSWKRLLDPKLNAPFASLLDFIVGVKDYRENTVSDFNMVGITATNEKTLVITLLTVTEHLPKVLCHHAFSVISDKPNVYSGAFVLIKNDPTEIYLEKNPLYWDAKSVAISGVKVLLSSDLEQNTYLFNIGQADWIMGNVDTARLLNKKSVIISSQFGTEYLFFKTTMKPVDNQNLRNALLNAIPWDELRKMAIIKASSLVFPIQGYPEVIGIVEQDMDLAKKLLNSSGYDQKTAPQINLCMPDDKNTLEKASLLITAWTELGVKVKLDPVPIDRYLSRIADSNSHVFSYVWIGDFADPLAFLELFRGDSNLNESTWKNQAYDDLLGEAANLREQPKRFEKLAEAEQILLDSGVIIPISHTFSLNVVDFDAISGWYDNVLDIHPFKYIKFNKPIPIPNLVFNKK